MVMGYATLPVLFAEGERAQAVGIMAAGRSHRRRWARSWW
jgi:hypothetical protein